MGIIIWACRGYLTVSIELTIQMPPFDVCILYAPRVDVIVISNVIYQE